MATYTRELHQGNKGDDVKLVQSKLIELGYLKDKADGIFGKKTLAAVKAFQKDKGLTVDGEVGKKTWNKLFPTSSSSTTSTTTSSTVDLKASGQQYAKEMDWWTSGIQKIFGKNVTATITDVKTGLQWKEVRKAGSKHADVQPKTSADTAKLKKAYGGNWSWARRPIWVTINGVTYAASMNGQPHGGSSINNNFPGHHCIHFTNSRTHGSDKVDANHQKAIKIAATTPLR